MDSVKKFRIKGLVPAVFTPMKENGDLNLELIPKYASFLTKKGIKSIFVNGTTGEGPSLTIDERKQVTEAWMAKNKHGLDHVVVHIGGANLRESQQLARHAVEVKVDAIALMPPTFIKTETVESLVEYSRQVAECAPNLPFFYYHLPMLTGVTLNMLDYMQKMERAVSSFRGIKYSYWNMTEASLCYNYAGCKYNILFGVDQQLLTALVLGIDAAIGSTYNFMPAIYDRVIESKNKGDLETARQEQLKAQRVLDVAFKYASGFPLAVQKMMMSMSSPVDLGPPRLPVFPLKDEQVQALKKDLTELGYFEWIKN